jgi:NADH:ubiquinone oxidoreductase subunit K
MDLVSNLAISTILFLFGIWGIFSNRKNIIIILMSIELMILAVNLNLLEGRSLALLYTMDPFVDPAITDIGQIGLIEIGALLSLALLLRLALSRGGDASGSLHF